MVIKGRLFCTDARCGAMYEAVGREEELETLTCYCGAGLELVGWPEGAQGPDDGFEIFPLAA